MPPVTDPRIDAYIAKAAPFAQPILTHLRALIRRALPEAEETIKWGMPHFTLRGRNIAGIAAFKAHCAFVVHGEGRQGQGERTNGGTQGMGAYGKIASLADLPADAELMAKLREAAARLAANGKAQPPKARQPSAPDIAVPDDFAAALTQTPLSLRIFTGLTPAQQRDYLLWITQAKQAQTRARRISQAIAWLGEGKRRNWKYEKR